ncbi:MAG: DUF4190 domain-containing protein [Hamadaea sp.]|nr:DUF4190 domain-containing protein [Hamadaea sp.]
MTDPEVPPAGTPEGADRSWNVLAIASAVVASCAAPGGIAALIMGGMALRQMARRTQRGQFLAILGILLGLVSITLSVGAAAVWVSDEGTSAAELRQGDCLPEMPGILSVTEFEVVPCTELHAVQVYAVAQVQDSAEEAVVASRAEVECAFGRENLTASARLDPAMTYMYMRTETAENGQITVFCLVGLGRWRKMTESIVK